MVCSQPEGFRVYTARRVGGRRRANQRWYTDSEGDRIFNMIEVEANLAAFGTSDALTGICRRFHVHRLDLFGSAATGRGFDPARLMGRQKVVGTTNTRFGQFSPIYGSDHWATCKAWLENCRFGERSREYSLSSASCSSMKLVFAPSRSLKCNGLPWVSMTMRAPFNRIGWNWTDEWRAQPLASA
jgi:hypothetical protein